VESFPQALGDVMVHWPATTTVQMLSEQVIARPFNQEVRQIERQADGSFEVFIYDTRLG
jgi:tryptophan 2-monooxygenase